MESVFTEALFRKHPYQCLAFSRSTRAGISRATALRKSFHVRFGEHRHLLVDILVVILSVLDVWSR